ncbi:porin family protein [Tenacibaculum sp. UWU-22]|uniref:porin family protein n=1 Tax=Tenacibaculum sp. UWU-22 TaxID=3234187 RepID=UPI0034DB79E2
MNGIKYITTLILLTVSIQMANAQAAIIAALFGDKVASEKFNLSMELGIPWSNFSNVTGSKPTNAINFGIAGNVKLSENWYVSPTVYFLSKRSINLNRFSLNSTDTNLNALYQDVPANLTLAYTDIPVFVYYQPNNSNFRFGIAPQISFCKKGNIVYEGNLGDFDQSIKDNVAGTDYGAILNIGYLFKTAHKGKGIILNVRYYNGFSDVFDNKFIAKKNNSSYFSIHISLPFISDKLTKKNLENK